MRVLIVKTSAFGDIIHCFPVISYLKNKFSNIRIEWVVEKQYAELLQAHPSVDKVHTINTKKWRKNPFSKETRSEWKCFVAQLKKYDLILDLQGNIKSALITLKAKSSNKVGFGRKTVAEWPNLLVTNYKYDPPPGQNIRKDYLFLVQSYFNDFDTFVDYKINLKGLSQVKLPEGVHYLICPGSAWPNKELSLTQWRDFLQEQENCRFLYVWGNEKERLFVEELAEECGGDVLPKLSLPELQDLIGRVSCVIAMDSLPLHLAGTTTTPTLSFFGPTLALKYNPMGESHEAIQGECPYGNSFQKRCHLLRTCSTGACIKSLNAKVLPNLGKDVSLRDY